MKLILSAALCLAATSASADCAAELARLQGGISKDGSLAPLEQPQAGIAKDGTTAPLNADPGIATSPADVQAQQDGAPTAAENAAEGRDAAIERARQAMAAGDEAGCMDALQGL